MRPILYSFRRCPYAIRARLAIAASCVEVELREVLLRDKAPAFLETSPSATVPCLRLDAAILDESYDIMIWALSINDSKGLRDMPADGYPLIERFDGPFKAALDKTKYAVRHPNCDPEKSRNQAMEMLAALEPQLEQGWLYGHRQTLADIAILPFVRQFAMIDKARFDQEATPNVARWLARFLASAQFGDVMAKYPMWREGDTPLVFGR